MLPVGAVSRIAHALANNTRLRHLRLDHNAVGMVGTRALIASARSGGGLQSVSLLNTGVSIKLARTLEAELKTNREAPGRTSFPP
jgi:hypothetical protein